MRYTTLDSLKVYGRAKTPVGQQSNTLDDAELTAAIVRAEEEIDCFCGTAFDRRRNSLENVPTCWVTDGWLHLRLRNPIITVALVQVLDMRGGKTTWTTLSSTNEFVEDPLDPQAVGESPHPGAWTYLYQATPILPDGPRSRYRAQVTYTSGYGNIPGSLAAITDRLAWWFYQIREMPMGRVADLASNTITSPLGLPKDVEEQLKSWRRLPV